MIVQRSPVLPRRSSTPNVHQEASADQTGTREHRRSPSSSQEQEQGEGSEAAVGAVAEVGSRETGEGGGEKRSGMDQIANKTVGKLDESVYKLFGQGSESSSSLSRSSSDTGSEGAIALEARVRKCVGIQLQTMTWE